MPWYYAISLTACIFAGFAFVHSFCVAENVKRLVARVMGVTFVQAFYRLLYSTFGFATTLLAVYLVTLIPDSEIFRSPHWLRWPMRGIQAFGLLIGAASFRVFDVGEFLGIRQAARHLKGLKPAGDMEGLTGNRLVTSGLYGVVRNPMYLGGILIFTFQPVITRNWLVVSALADAYFIFGALAEERRMLMRFGEEYRLYRERVPLLIPGPKAAARALMAALNSRGR